MRRVIVLALLALMVVPMAAWADNIQIINKGGSISIGQSGIQSNQSRLLQYGNVQAQPGHSLGTVSFSTGALVSGSIDAGGVFSSTGSTFIVVGKSKGVPHGIIFNGTFTGDIDWTLVSQQGAKLVYQLSGNLIGQLYTGRTVTGTTTQTIITFKSQLKQGIGHINIGNTSLSTPEPATLGLLGTGLLCIAGLVRRKLTI